MVSLNTFAELTAASAETQSVLSMLYRGGYTKGVSNGNTAVRNETSSSLIGTELSWDSQRRMHAELSSIVTTPVESLASPPSSLCVLTPTDAYRFEPARSGLTSSTPNTAASPVVAGRDVQASQIEPTPLPAVLPSSSSSVLSILDLQSRTVRQTEIPQAQAAEAEATSGAEPGAASPFPSSGGIFSWACFPSSIPGAPREAEVPAARQCAPPLSASSGQAVPVSLQPNSASTASSEPGSEASAPAQPKGSVISQLDASTVSLVPAEVSPINGLSSQRIPVGRASMAKPSASAQPTQGFYVTFSIPAVSQPETSPIAPTIKRDSASISESPLPVSDQAAGLERTQVKSSNQLAANATSAEQPLPSGITDPAITSTAVGSGIGLRTGNETPQSPVDHFSFELTLRPQNPLSADDSAGPTNPGNDGTGLAVSPRGVVSRPGSPAPGPESGTSGALDGAADSAAAKRSMDAPNDELASPPAQSTGSVGMVVSSAQIIPTHPAQQAVLKPEASPASISTGPTIAPPETELTTQQGLVHDVQLRMQGQAGENVSIRLSDRAGEVQISVRSSDPVTATTLRQDISTLSASLEKQGWKTDLSESPQTSVHGLRDPSSQQQADPQGRQRSSPQWEDPPERKRQSPMEQWADINQQETK